ncbi:hypothetical protein ACB094_04G095800 [Castanea mollissima]
MNHGTESNEKRDDGADPETHNKYKEIIATLPRSNRHHWIVDLYRYEGFWFPLRPLEGLLLAQDCFKPQPNDALNFAILTRSSFGESTNPLLSRLSHDCVPFLELEIGASLESPERILFIKYEDLTNETIHYVKKMNDFENLSSLEVNQSGPMQFLSGIVGENNAFFRKGKVEDWKNHLTTKMATRLDQINKQKLSSLGLTLHVSANT